MTRYSWTQAICAPCFEGMYPDRDPVRIIDADLEHCVICYGETRDGIYIRIDPKSAPYPTKVKA
jgi:hypothetical protein